MSLTKKLNPENAFIFRITHVDNVPWILKNGIHCRNSAHHDPNFVGIGNADLIDKRAKREVPVKPGGVLSDYVPFYFTPYSIMLYNIYTGYGGVPRRANSEIVILVSSLHKLVEQGISFVFTSGHAYPVYAEYFNQLEDLDKIDWPLLSTRNFQNDPNDPEKKERYQAEALIHEHVPISSLFGLVCASEKTKNLLTPLVEENALELEVRVQPTWYF